MYLVEAEATLTQVYGFMLFPYPAQTEDYFRELLCRRAGACGHDPGQE